MRAVGSTKTTRKYGMPTSHGAHCALHQTKIAADPYRIGGFHMSTPPYVVYIGDNGNAI